MNDVWKVVPPTRPYEPPTPDYWIAVGEGPSVFLFHGATMLGGWMNQPGSNAAEIAAEVLKAGHPHAPVVFSAMNDEHRAERRTWWSKVRTILVAENFSVTAAETPGMSASHESPQSPSP